MATKTIKIKECADFLTYVETDGLAYPVYNIKNSVVVEIVMDTLKRFDYKLQSVEKKENKIYITVSGNVEYLDELIDIVLTTVVDIVKKYFKKEYLS